MIRTAYDRWTTGDIDGFLEFFVDDAVFAVPGQTSVSGDHDKAAFRKVLERLAEASQAGKHRQELICQYVSDSSAVLIFDTHFGPGEADKYHSIHELIFRDGRPCVWMLYVHEYDLFSRAWE